MCARNILHIQTVITIVIALTLQQTKLALCSFLFTYSYSMKIGIIFYYCLILIISFLIQVKSLKSKNKIKHFMNTIKICVKVQSDVSHAPQNTFQCSIRPKILPHSVISIHVLCTMQEQFLIEDDTISYLRSTQIGNHFIAYQKQLLHCA